QDVGGQAPVPGCGFDEIDWRLETGDGRLDQPGHLDHLPGEEFAEDGPDVDRGKKIARAARSSGGAGVVAGLAVVEGELHESGHGDRARLTDDVRDPVGQSFFTVTNTSASPRQSRICARRPDCTAPSSRAASAAFDTLLRFTWRITSPERMPAPAAGPSG